MLLRPIHPSYAFYCLVAGVITGIVVGIAWHVSLPAHPLLIGTLVCAAIVTFRWATPLLATAAFLIGCLLGSCRTYPIASSLDRVQPYLGQTLILTGRLADDPTTSSGSTVISLRTPTIALPDDELSLSGTVYVTLASQSPALERSDLVTITGRLDAGFGTYLGKIYRAEVVSVSRSALGDPFARFKRWFAARLRDSVPSPEVDLGLGYLMGLKSGLSTEFSEALSAVGMTHVVVASGAHLAILTGAARRLFGKISKFAGLLFSLLMIAAFVLVVGFTPSMTRAALVASLSLLVGYVGRRFTPLRLIGFVAMLTLLIDPQNLLNLGWQLSFASFFALLVVAPRLQATFYGGKRPPWLAGMLITSIAITLICAPILIYNFGSLSFLSLLANLIILPTLPYAMLGLVLTGITSLPPLAWATTRLLGLHIWLVEFLSEQTAFVITLPSSQPLIFLLYLPLAAYLVGPSILAAIRTKCVIIRSDE